MTDWKDSLSKLKESGELAVPADEQEGLTIVKETSDNKKSGPIEIITDRKGRKGKTATIIAGFADEEDVEAIASELKKKLATGGSVRDCEILIQGDRKNEAKEILISMGFKIKK